MAIQTNRPTENSDFSDLIVVLYSLKFVSLSPHDEQPNNKRYNFEQDGAAKGIKNVDIPEHRFESVLIFPDLKRLLDLHRTGYSSVQHSFGIYQHTRWS